LLLEACVRACQELVSGGIREFAGGVTADNVSARLQSKQDEHLEWTLGRRIDVATTSVMAGGDSASKLQIARIYDDLLEERMDSNRMDEGKEADAASRLSRKLIEYLDLKKRVAD